MNWTKAKKAQLINIAYHDDGADLAHRWAALDELQRRSNAVRSRQANRTNMREKRSYGR